MNAGMLPSSSQHRRKISMPSTPPETPMGAYFDSKQTAPPTDSVHISIYPDSPPITPERRVGESQRESEKQKEKEHQVPRRTSVAYAHHRRTSTATIIRLAAARQGVVLTPSKVLTLFLIVFSATYLASFLPGPLASLFHHRSPRTVPRPSGAPSYYSVPKVSGALNNKPLQRTMPIGETAQRRAWEDSFPHRIPPQQHVVPVKQDLANLARSYHGDLYRAHPELLVSNSGSQPRRRPLRFGKAAADDKEKPERRAEPEAKVDDSFDDAARSPREATVPVERQAQINRMKKMSAAKQGAARVGSTAPLDSSEPVRNERIHVEGASNPKRKVKKPKVMESEKVQVRAEDGTAKKGAKPRLGKKDRQVVDDETRRTGGAHTVDEWAELEDGSSK
ncbi:hypothetical protein JCM16303_001906 [Sporobolomyces ruberrimus]